MIARTLLAAAVAMTCLYRPDTAFADATLDALRTYFAYDAIPLDMEVSSTQETNGIQRTDFSFAAFDNERVTARLELPEGEVKPPVIILLHGVTQSLNQWWRTDGGAYSFPSAHREALLDAGYAVLAMDARNHGGRIGPTDFGDPMEYLNSSYFEAARKMISQSAIDMRRLLDVAQTLEEIDSSRIGVVGFSLGASIGYLGAAVDERVDSAVLIGYPFLSGDEPPAASFTSPFHFADALDARPLLFIAGNEDYFTPKDAMQALQTSLHGSAAVRWLDSGHDFPASTSALTVNHFDRTLR